MNKPTTKTKDLANHEIVTLAVYLLGGEAQRVDTEDIAVKTNELAPGRFTWRKYPTQINIDTVRKRLWDAASPTKGEYLNGSEKEGWTLTSAGLKFATDNQSLLTPEHLGRPRFSLKAKQWMRNERARMLSTTAYAKIRDRQNDIVTQQEAEEFFRIDAYVTGEARDQKIKRALASFSDDEDLAEAVKILAQKIPGGEKK